MSESFEVDGEIVLVRDLIGNHTLWHQNDNRANKNAGFAIKKKSYKKSKATLTKNLGSGKKMGFLYEDVYERTEKLKELLKQALSLFPKEKSEKKRKK